MTLTPAQARRYRTEMEKPGWVEFTGNTRPIPKGCRIDVVFNDGTLVHNAYSHVISWLPGMRDSIARYRIKAYGKSGPG